MARHHLDEPARDLLAVTARLGGVHAQLASAAELALGIRSTDAGGAAVRDALWRDRTLVKTWAMRGTLHLLPAAEFPLWVAALRTRKRQRYPPAWERNFGVTPAETEAITEAVGQVLPGRHLTREELAAEIARNVGEPRFAELLGSGWGALLKPAALLGELCFGPSRGQQVTFVSPRDWLPGPWREPPADEALAVVLRRFLDGYGPATHDDVARWWGVQPKVGRDWVARHAADLEQVDLDGRPHWMTPEGAAGLAGAGPPPPVRLLGGFDPYVVAPVGQRRALVPQEYHPRVSRTSGWISPVLLVDGRYRGVWEYERTGAGVVATVTPFGALPVRVRRAAERQAAAFGPVLGGDVGVRWADPV